VSNSFKLENNQDDKIENYDEKESPKKNKDDDGIKITKRRNFRRIKSEASTVSKFQDVINEIRTIKIDLFGNPEESMDFYKRNKNAYDPKLIQRLTKIGKVLELEELLEFYNSNNSSKRKSEEVHFLKTTNLEKSEGENNYN
jgi:hypothetical protein